MERYLSFEFVRVTEVAAIESARWMGYGKKHEADHAATTAMRQILSTIPMHGTVVIGEGEMDDAPMLYIGETIGSEPYPDLDIAVDPLEGTNILAKGLWNSMSIIAVGPKGSLLHAPDIYMEKIAAGPAARGHIDIRLPLSTNVRMVAEALRKDVTDIVVAVLDRERHEMIIREIRELGARVKLLPDGDVAAAIKTALPNADVDMLLGVGGAPEGVITAAALQCLGGDFQGRLVPESEEQVVRCHSMGIDDVERHLSIDTLVSGDVVFAATGVTDGDLLRGVRLLSNGKAQTHSVFMRAKTGTIRFIEALHDLDRKSAAH